MSLKALKCIAWADPSGYIASTNAMKILVAYLETRNYSCSNNVVTCINIAVCKFSYAYKLTWNHVTRDSELDRK